MTSPTVDRCAIGLSDETLSAWRDGLLDAAALARIGAHVPNCPTCRSRLATLDQLGGALRGQAEPDLRARVWEGLRAHLETGERRRHTLAGRRPLVGGLAAVAAALLLVALFAAVLGSRQHRSTPAATATTAPTPMLTPTATVLPQLSQWQTAQNIGTGLLPDVAFGSSTPGVGYACIADHDAVITVSVTHDGGATWRALGRPAQGALSRPVQGARCVISVDPADARDVVLVGGPNGTSSFTVSRSFDSGAHWTQQPIDPGPVAGGYEFQHLGWAGSTLVVTANLYEYGAPDTRVLVSVNKERLVLINGNNRLGGVSFGEGRAQFIGGTSAMIYFTVGDANQVPIHFTTLKSTDRGKTWSVAAFADSGRRVYPVAYSLDGRAIAAVYGDAPGIITVSIDGGKTWRKAPAFPDGVTLDLLGLLLAPDGTLFAAPASLGQAQGTDNNIYTARLGAVQWSLAAVLPDSASLRTLTTDSAGRPTALWARQGLGRDWTLVAHRL